MSPLPITPNVHDGEVLQKLLDWIDSQPELAHNRKAANSAICNYYMDASVTQERIIVNSSDVKVASSSLFNQILDVVWVPGKNMRGKAYAIQSSNA